MVSVSNFVYITLLSTLSFKLTVYFIVLLVILSFFIDMELIFDEIICVTCGIMF